MKFSKKIFAAVKSVGTSDGSKLPTQDQNFRQKESSYMKFKIKIKTAEPV
jgi:hypothetical protein